MWAKEWHAIAIESDPDALMEADEHLETLRSANYLWTLVLTLPVLADAKVRAGLPEAALDNLSDVKEIVERTGAVSFDAEIRRVEADARLAIDPSADAAPLLHEAVDIARLQGAKSLELRAATSLVACIPRGVSGTQLLEHWPQFMPGSPTASTPVT